MQGKYQKAGALTRHTKTQKIIARMCTHHIQPRLPREAPGKKARRGPCKRNEQNMFRVQKLALENYCWPTK